MPLIPQAVELPPPPAPPATVTRQGGNAVFRETAPTPIRFLGLRPPPRKTGPETKAPSREAGPEAAAAAPAGGVGPAAAETRRVMVVRFAFDSAAVTPWFRQALGRLPAGCYHLLGRTDPRGPVAYNLRLGAERALAVAAALPQAQQLTIASAGLLGASADPARWPEDRRVEVYRTTCPPPEAAGARHDAPGAAARPHGGR